MAYGIVAAVLWLGLHAFIAESGVLAREMRPPPVLPYVLVTSIVCVVLAGSRIGTRLADRLPLPLLVGFLCFRLPLEALLHMLYTEGMLPVQITWSGLNFDVITGLSALVIGLVAVKHELPRWIYWVWNIMGLSLLCIVVAIALLSAPLPIRQFTNDPPVLLVFHAPFTWVVSVHVFAALLGHIVVFRKLLNDG